MELGGKWFVGNGPNDTEFDCWIQGLKFGSMARITCGNLLNSLDLNIQTISVFVSIEAPWIVVSAAISVRSVTDPTSSSCEAKNRRQVVAQ